MIVLAWRFWTAASDGQAWFRHCDETLIQGLTADPDNRGVFVLSRTQMGETEFILLSFWDAPDYAAVKATVERALADLEDDDRSIRREVDTREFELAGRGAIALTAALSLDL
jgi:hypothetical protein